MRYCQAQALIHVLINNPEFKSFNQDKRDLACNEILEDVCGQMMKDIVLLETVRSLSKKRSDFKLTLAQSEFDMVIYTSVENTCAAFEVTHSAEIVPHQYHILEDEELCQAVEQQYGTITRKRVLYGGESCTFDNGIKCLIAKEYLKSL